MTTYSRTIPPPPPVAGGLPQCVSLGVLSPCQPQVWIDGPLADATVPRPRQPRQLPNRRVCFNTVSPNVVPPAAVKPPRRKQDRDGSRRGTHLLDTSWITASTRYNAALVASAAAAPRAGRRGGRGKNVVKKYVASGHRRHRRGSRGSRGSASSLKRIGIRPVGASVLGKMGNQVGAAAVSGNMSDDAGYRRSILKYHSNRRVRDGGRRGEDLSLIHQSHSPRYEQKFSLELLDRDASKRLLISVWNKPRHKDHTRSESRLLGCMSFGMKHLLQQTKSVDGWYYLLREKCGRYNHQPVLDGKRDRDHPPAAAPEDAETLLRVRHTVV